MGFGVWGLTHLTASDYKLDRTLKVLRLLRFLECAEMGLGFKVLGFLATGHWFLKGLKVLKWLRGLECAGKGNRQYALALFPTLQHCPFSAWHAPFGATHHLSPQRGNQDAMASARLSKTRGAL